MAMPWEKNAQANMVGGPQQPESLPEDRDPWVHRAEGMRCRTCMYYVRKEHQTPRALVDGRGAVGRCRRHAPTMNGYPVVFETDWCGDHKLDEAKA